MWGEGNIRSYVQALFRGSITSPVLTVNRVNGTVHLKKNTFSCITAQDDQRKLNGVKFNFDTLVKSSVQLFWGVSELSFKRKILQPFKDNFEKIVNEAKEKGKENYQQDQHLEDDENMERGLLDVNENQVDDITASVYETPLSQIDMNRLLTYEEYVEKSDLIYFDKGLNQSFEMPVDEMIDQNVVDNYFTSLIVRETPQTNNNTNNEEAENAEGQVETTAPEIQNTEEERLGNQLTRDLLADEDETIQSDSKLPLVIVLKPTNSSDTLKRYEGEDSSLDYDRELQSLYVICNFKRYENSEEGVYYRGNVVKIFAQTESELFELEEVYGADENDENEVEECIVCFSEPRDITILPCKHKCVCHECFSRIDKCPICRTNVRSFLTDGGNTTTESDPNTQNNESV
ncbi:predicted protein [Naegleria gruberi]|uniref:Predicted protein n=1 Tax=Naegleria gruberi TaxID=5762 RepID=D2VDZ5_NAEGR|nr:uncharacterized protein NAEGRDRAFT_48775 [Naegleria gruberi]EFC45085.1 predicted protein [Naegleria gruberi]|eukprot:XP_002677829.1 predicted protein [Naegleria gruberi strain NEG-M]